jgi:hypothetical protein
MMAPTGPTRPVGRPFRPGPTRPVGRPFRPGPLRPPRPGNPWFTRSLRADHRLGGMATRTPVRAARGILHRLPWPPGRSPWLTGVSGAARCRRERVGRIRHRPFRDQHRPLARPRRVRRRDQRRRRAQRVRADIDHGGRGTGRDQAEHAQPDQLCAVAPRARRPDPGDEPFSCAGDQQVGPVLGPPSVTHCCTVQRSD